MPQDDEWKALNLHAGDSVKLIAIRAAYVVQLLVSIAGGTSQNLKNMFTTLQKPAIVQSLCDMDSCLLSMESMFACWHAALTDLLAHGRMDIKSILQAANVKAVTSVALTLCGPPKGDDENGGDTRNTGKMDTDTSDETALFSWTELLTFGCEGDMPSADQLIRLQATLRSEIVAVASRLESTYRDRMCVYIEKKSDAETKKRRGHNTAAVKSTVLFKIEDNPEFLRSPTDPKVLYYKLPKDLKLVFFGHVGSLYAV